MSELLAARAQMAMSLGFHIVFAAIGMAMPLFMVIAEIRFRQTKEAEYLALARAWAKGTAVLFAVGAVSGTVLSFELGLLFPRFMKLAGPLVGMPFSLEGFAFFAEGIFLGIYLYGWDKVRPGLHVLAGVIVTLSGLASAVFVIIANAWMNAPTGFRLVDGQLTDIDPIAAMRTPFALHEALHMVLAAFMATGFAAAAIHAAARRRAPASTFHQKALAIALAVAIPATLAQPLVGHYAGQVVARHQPLKLAAMERLERTQSNAPLRIGPFEIPSGLSLLAFNRPGAVVTGLDAFPRADWPSPVVRVAWQAMVGIGTALAGLAFWALFLRLRRRAAWLDGRRFLFALILAGPLGFLAIEAGWVVTEVGRQPWVVYGVLRTADSVTPMPGLIVPCVTFTLVYLGLAAAVVAVLRHQFRSVKP
ncbi:MAG TPA: cytochrome ubiquinol oxidase subunit I [Kofleriaceae bacterium]|nr:cytochrome ubiquinol oxidase subunit I [Kofleriaceae bacterium]